MVDVQSNTKSFSTQELRQPIVAISFSRGPCDPFLGNFYFLTAGVVLAASKLTLERKRGLEPLDRLSRDRRYYPSIRFTISL